MNTDESLGDSYLRVRWPVIATSAVIFAGGSLAALVVVASIKNADTLSVVALALAVLAFSIQILVFVAQTWSDSRQVAQNHAVNAETKALLAELQTHARDTNSMMNDQYKLLLEKLFTLTKEPAVAVDDAASDNEQTEALEGIRAVVLEEMGRSGLSPRARYLPLDGDSISSARRSVNWPSRATAENLGPKLRDLSEGSQQILARLSRDYMMFDDALQGLRFDPDDAAELERRELVVRQGGERGGKVKYKLSPDGARVARIFGAPLPVPVGWARAIPWLEGVRGSK